MSNRQITRYTLKERLCHWITAGCYVYCLATGLAFYTPHLFWLAMLLGGGPTSRYWHPLLGVAFLLATAWMHRLWRPDMPLTQTDRRWLRESRAYATNQDGRVPPQDRFNAGQKIFYWAMFYGAGCLLISGALMWFPEFLPVSLGWVRPLAIIVHECAALVTIGGFIVHIYMGAFMVPGSTHAMVSGEVSETWAKAHHALWYHRVFQKPE